MTSAFPLENLIKNQRCWFTSDLCIENPCTPSFPAFLHFYIGIFQPLYTNSWVAKKLMGNFSFTSKKCAEKLKAIISKFCECHLHLQYRNLFEAKRVGFFVGRPLLQDFRRQQVILFVKKEKVSKAASWKSFVPPFLLCFHQLEM